MFFLVVPDAVQPKTLKHSCSEGSRGTVPIESSSQSGLPEAPIRGVGLGGWVQGLGYEVTGR